VKRYPNARLLRTGGNLGYGTAVNRAVAEITPESEFVVVANPDVQWGAGCIDVLLDAAGRWPRAGALGPLIHDPDGSIYPSARHLPSLIRGGMHAVVGPFWKPTVDGGIPAGTNRAQRTRCRMVVRIVPVAARSAFDHQCRASTSALHVHGGRRPG
jgi:hypothetical protein